MVLSCLPVSLFQNIINGTITVREWSLTAAEIGLDAFDISILFVQQRTPSALSQLRTDLQAGGIPVAMLTLYSDFTDPDPVRRQRQLAFALADIAVAAELGIRYIRITAGQYYPEVNDYDAINNIYECYCKCLEKAKQYGVELLWENHSKPGAWQRPDFNYNIERLFLMHERIKELPIGFNLDIANAYALNCLPQILDICFEKIRSVHVNDLLSISPLRFCGIGRGIVPIHETLQKLLLMKYDGLVSIEECSMKGIEGIKCSVDTIRAMLSIR